MTQARPTMARNLMAQSLPTGGKSSMFTLICWASRPAFLPALLPVSGGDRDESGLPSLCDGAARADHFFQIRGRGILCVQLDSFVVTLNDHVGRIEPGVCLQRQAWPLPYAFRCPIAWKGRNRRATSSPARRLLPLSTGRPRIRKGCRRKPSKRASTSSVGFLQS